MQCRFCLEEKVDMDTSFFETSLLAFSNEESFISPCLCRGTQKWIHRNCLDQWRRTSSKARDKCNTCHFVYVCSNTPIIHRVYLVELGKLGCLFLGSLLLVVLGVTFVYAASHSLTSGCFPSSVSCSDLDPDLFLCKAIRTMAVFIWRGAYLFPYLWAVASLVSLLWTNWGNFRNTLYSENMAPLPSGIGIVFAVLVPVIIASMASFKLNVSPFWCVLSVLLLLGNLSASLVYARQVFSHGNNGTSFFHTSRDVMANVDCFVSLLFIGSFTVPILCALRRIFSTIETIDDKVESIRSDVGFVLTPGIQLPGV